MRFTFDLVGFDLNTIDVIDIYVNNWRNNRIPEKHADCSKIGTLIIWKITLYQKTIHTFTDVRSRKLLEFVA